MEDGVKGDTAKPTEAKFIGKAGWVKKCSGKFLGSYKDRYIRVEKTDIVVYEDEDLKNCLERVDLENYDQCREFRSAFKKKNRLVLVRAPKCSNKIQDVKIQLQNAEEKDAWITALSDGISRAKNKIFDEVKVDESCSLEHVTRTRPKGNQGRRPPTRIHMKEVANLSSDGILRKDLDPFDNTPNGTHPVNAEDDAPTKAVKPPMPPSKLSESPQETPEAEPTPPKKILKPPMPPSKNNKPSPPGEGETPKEVEPAPPTPPNKASDTSEEPDGTRITPSSSPPTLRDPSHPPMPPSKDKKPTQTVEWEVSQQSCGASGDIEEESPVETLSDDQGKNDSVELGDARDSTPPPLKTAFKPPEAEPGSSASEEPDESPAEKEDSSPTLTAPEKEEPDGSSVALEAEGNSAPAISLSVDALMPPTPLTKSAEPSPQPAKKKPGPPAPHKKKPLKSSGDGKPCDLKEGSTDGPISAESRGACLPSKGVPTTVISDLSKDKDDPTLTVEPKDKMAALSTADTTEDTADAMVFPDHTAQKRKQEESRDSSQHPDQPQGGDSRGASASVGGSGRDDGSKAEAEPAEGHVSPEGKVVTGARRRAQMLKQVQTKRNMRLTPAARLRKPLKEKSASMGDLLSTVQGEEWAVEENAQTSPGNDTNELKNKVALELEDTVELLDTLSSEQATEDCLGAKGGPKGFSPEELLTKAVEKLRKADQLLRMANSLKQASPLEKKHRVSL